MASLAFALLYCIFLNDCLKGVQQCSHRIGNTCLSYLCGFALYFGVQTSHLARTTGRGCRCKQRSFSLIVCRTLSQLSAYEKRVYGEGE
jgi:hypothetical protein